ncbi:hypothetical protein AF331_03060 [Rossellomorea marisflavi]|uniref:Helicase Helix-turn-helix domain-containing protein n=2 Tax=Rossellomorea marisflavi TaxID=189381 RepID=A0A0M0GNV3_9BACI|nr:hypothetical protein AF331_03060 [Rossellomorea marisflavi]
MTYLHYLILDSLERLGEERSVYSVFHIMKGKKSSQSIQDAHLFGLQALFLSLPKLKREYFDRCIAMLQDKGFITLNDDNRARLTHSGKEGLAFYFQKKPYPAHMDGLKHGDQSILLWKRLSLLVQVLSNARMNETSYFPVQRDRKVQDWLKVFIRKQGKTEVLSAKLFEELYTLLAQTTPGEDPGILVERLTGYRDYGATEGQSADRFGVDREEYRFRFLNLLHFIIARAKEDAGAYPIVYSIIEEKEHIQPLTASTKKTLELFQKGIPVEEIARIRELKVNTIEDHLIEIILTLHDFPVTSFIDEGVYEEVLGVLTELKTKRLKPIKERFPELSYFQIRAVIAKAGETP